MDELIAFARARLDEVEKTARYAGPARIAWLTYHNDAGQMLYTTVAADAPEIPGEYWCADGKELPEPASARVVYDPASVLADVEADRRILAEYTGATAITGEDDQYAAGLAMAIRSRAARFSGHPDYRQEWRP